MSWRLQGITDWAERAARANWSVKELARQCDISIRTLQTHFQETTGQSPGYWMNRERQRRAVKLLCKGSAVKEAAVVLGYKNQHAFSNAFKAHYGQSPTQYKKGLSKRNERARSLQSMN